MSIALVPFAFFDFLTAECNMSMYVIAYGIFYYAFPVPSNAAASLK